MQRLKAINLSAAEGGAKELLEDVRRKLGVAPNIVRTMANSPAVLEGYLGFSGALSKGALSARLREQIALVVGETNGCNYCVSAHTSIGKTVGLTEDVMLDSRRGVAEDRRDQAALQFARSIVLSRGRVRDYEFDHLRTLGFTDGEISEIIGNVALNLFTNYFNHVAGTDVDFPEVPSLAGASECGC